MPKKKMQSKPSKRSWAMASEKVHCVTRYITENCGMQRRDWYDHLGADMSLDIPAPIQTRFYRSKPELLNCAWK